MFSIRNIIKDYIAVYLAIVAIIMKECGIKWNEKQYLFFGWLAFVKFSFMCFIFFLVDLHRYSTKKYNINKYEIIFFYLFEDNYYYADYFYQTKKKTHEKSKI